MVKPDKSQIEEVRRILINSIETLVKDDPDIFNLESEQPEISFPELKSLNRKLHETTINHRLAVYIEHNLKDRPDFKKHFVDIEYNRYNNMPKMLRTPEGWITARPDIIVHSRMNKAVSTQHYLIIEAKKENISKEDITKVKAFISDDNYNYMFGLTISYCSDSEFVIANLFYFSGEKITSELIKVSK